MPRDNNGAYSLPAGYLAVQGETIQPSQHNPPLEDIASSLTASLPRSGVAPMTGPLKLADGTVGAPALAFASVPSSGWYKTTSGIALAISGALAVEFGAAGIVTGVTTESIPDKAVTLRKLYHPSGPSKLLGSNSNAALTITGTANNGSGLVRLTVADSSTFATGQSKTVAGVLGTTEANGTWTITVVDGTHIDLQASAFANTYVSGGTIGGGFEEISLGAGVSMAGSTLTASQDIQGGRLTIATATPVLSAVVSNATQVFWTPDENNQISLYDSSVWSVIASAEVSMKFTDTQNGATHNGTRVIDGLTDTSKLMIGMEISGTGVGAASVIQSIDSPTQVTGTVNSSASASVSITFKVPVDKAVDIFGKNVNGALGLRGVFRSALLTPNSMDKQNGVDVLSSDHSLRWLGTVVTSATAGQIDWALKGSRRFRVWNRNNKRVRHHVEAFASAGTWGAAIGATSLEIEAAGGGAGVSGNATASSFGSLAAASGGTTSSAGVGTIGDTTFSGTGGYATSGNGPGGRAFAVVDGKAQPATAAVAVGAPGGGGGGPGWVIARETVEV